MCSDFFIDDMLLHESTLKHTLTFEKIKKTWFNELDILFAEIDKKRIGTKGKMK